MYNAYGLPFCEIIIIPIAVCDPRPGSHLDKDS